MPARIVGPVSRHLSVTDIDTSIAFYCNVLGFDARPIPHGDGVPAVVEVVSGPARIQLGVGSSAYDSTGVMRPRGAALLFFATDDVVAMRDAVRERGGSPSEIEKVNWIKMQMFQIVDPDGHIIWLGTSFQEPELVANGANVQGEPVSHPWGLRDFHVLDLEGNRLTFAQPFE